MLVLVPSSPHPLQICHKLPAPSLNTNFPPGSVTLKLIFAAAVKIHLYIKTCTSHTVLDLRTLFSVLSIESLTLIHLQYYQQSFSYSGSRPCGSRCDHSVGHVHHPGQHPELAPPRCLHQGYRCLDRGLRRVRVLRPPGVRPRQLRFKAS